MENISKKVKHGIKWQFITNIIGQGMYFVNGVILARILSPKEFGIYGMALVLSSFVFMFWNLGLDSAIIQRKEISKEHLNAAFSICVIMGITCFILIWFTAPYLALFFKEPIITALSRLIGITFLIYALDRVPSALLNKNLHFKRLSFLGLLDPLLYTVVAIPLAISGYGPFSFALGIIAGALAIMLFKVYWGVKMFAWRPKLTFNIDASKHLLGFGLFVTMTNLVHYFLWNLPNIITGKFFGALALGYFHRASSMSSTPMKKVHSNIAAVLLPAFSNIQDNKKKIKDWFKKFNFFTYTLISPLLIFFMFFPHDFIVGLFGEKWLASVPLLTWLSLGALVGAPCIYFRNILKAIGKPHLNFIISLTRLVPFAIILLFATKWGLKGIAIALLISTIMALILYLIVLQRDKIVTFRDVVISAFEPIVISFIACLIVLGIKHALVININNSEIRLGLLVFAFVVILLPCYLIRYFKKSFITYLQFDIKNIIKTTMAISKPINIKTNTIKV